MRLPVGEDDAAHQLLLQMSLRGFDADAQVTSVRTEAQERPVQKQKAQTVLVVDDEALVRQVVGKCLERGGYGVLYAEDGPSALETFRTLAGRVDLVLLDMHMPRMGGAEVYAALRAIAPDVKVLISSGVDRQETCEALARLDPPAGFVEKPYTVKTLIDKVGEVLRGHTAAPAAR